MSPAPRRQQYTLVSPTGKRAAAATALSAVTILSPFEAGLVIDSVDASSAGILRAAGLRRDVDVRVLLSLLWSGT